MSGDTELSKASNLPHYRNDYIQNHVDPFGEEFQTEATVQVGRQTSKKKGRALPAASAF
jgi:hypothetical protein